MRRSETTLFTSREATHDNDTVALTHRAGLVRQFGSGLYGFTPTGERVRQRLIDVVEAEMFTFGNRDGKRMCLAPSHEEGVVHLVDGAVRSYPLRRDSVTRHDTIFGVSGRDTGVL